MDYFIEYIVSDKLIMFISSKFDMCSYEVNGIKHIIEAPYHPSSNEEAECFIYIFKQAMRAAESDEGVLQYKLAQFLLTYLSIPHSIIVVIVVLNCSSRDTYVPD